MIRILPQFIDGAQIQLKINYHMKNTEPGKSLMPSLFQIAASLDDTSPVAPAKSPFARLPMDNWAFSRERLENALRARLSHLKRRSSTVGDESVARQPVRLARRAAKNAVGARPVRSHPFEMAGAMVESA